jgi:hypothetical protein
MSYTTIPIFFIKNKEPRIKSRNDKNYSLKSITLSFPFSAGVSVEVLASEKDAAKETVVALINRRILNTSECCASCSQQSINSLKEIKSDLVQLERKLTDSINGSLFYFIDSIVHGINQFLKYIEDYQFLDTFDQNRDTYFQSFNIIRNHIVQCLYQISKIAELELSKDLFAVKNNKESWEYIENDLTHREGIIDILI